MSPIIQFTKEGLMRGKVVPPSWYHMKIDSISESPAKFKEGRTPSTNYPVEATIMFNAEDGSKEYAGIIIEWNFNSKAQRAIADFLRCFGHEAEIGKRFELSAAEGKEIDVFVENGVWEGRQVNRVEHKYRPCKVLETT
jgi:hypothetical protein